MKRKIDVEGCSNFRDLGGYPTESGGELRWRVVFRSDGLHELTRAGVATLRDEIELGHIIDLRSDAELGFDGRGLLEQEAMHFHHMALFPDHSGNERASARDVSLGKLYLGMVAHAGPRLAAVIDELSHNDTPSVFHCSAGKDRTGVISALLLGTLGVANDIIVADYAATREGLEGIVAKLSRSKGYENTWKALPPHTLHADPETMVEFLAELSARYGGVRECVRAIGVGDESVARLEARMLA
jgi:protein tyrosine/serine phosphatase